MDYARTIFHWRSSTRFLILFVFALLNLVAVAEQPSDALVLPEMPDEAADVLSPADWKQVRSSIERALAYLASQQQSNGAFPTLDHAQPAITSLGIMAYLAAGYPPGTSDYGKRLTSAIDYVISTQHADGLLLGVPLPPPDINNPIFCEGAYSHPIAGVMLGEVYGMTSARQAAKVRITLEKAVEWTRRKQLERKRQERDMGGWRYLMQANQNDSDISLTAWHLMFLRSAKNAGFSIPPQWIDEAMGYINRCYDEQLGTFAYALYGDEHRVTRGMTGAGILSLSLGGMHETATARSAGEWLLRYPYDNYNVCPFPHERYHYGLYYCTQAMFQLGGKYWREFYPRTVKTLLKNQRPDGSWDPEGNGHDHIFGTSYTTALVVLALATPYQLLPIYQR